MEKKLNFKQLESNFNEYVSDWKISQMIEQEKLEEYPECHKPSCMNVNEFIKNNQFSNYR
ncbi:MAG: hypothetical protein PWR27_1928 [Petroclostridium sp.]|uniref:hypothetical protein n=1 Tax=Petroclostridium xylanilyticum TaxID=1792311 RepID=UPI000B9999FB|nr:hypothetical protein [Petroclostridium xylanilyticum]MBZ4646649.1 hypothetical protein [Clostridia bacterium]MDK2811219.1 hypothetical protein [Petroclostridium sp.]